MTAISNNVSNIKMVSSHYRSYMSKVHGDGAIAGQGINQECLLMGQLPHFEVGGGVHLVVNNQLAFTTPPERGRGTLYCTDIAKLISAPVVHVNGDAPEVINILEISFILSRTLMIFVSSAFSTLPHCLCIM